MMPFVAIFAMIFGMASSYLLCVFVLDINAESYLSIIQENMTLKDITGGLIKSGFFGFIFAWIFRRCVFMAIRIRNGNVCYVCLVA
jgi:ABC-type transporter Mla maintaining outer membrane lipid asymmetry permease subunit MlaE